jgi:hypothetical protein
MSDRAPGPEPQVDEGAIVQLPLDWSGVLEEPVRHVNQFMAQVGSPAQDGVPDGVYLSFGSVEPPPVFGSPAERRRTYDQIAVLKVNVHGRLHFSRSHLRDLVQVLEELGRQYDALIEHGDRAGPQIEE